MENTQITMQEKLGFFKTLKEALTIPFKNPHFIIFTLLTSLPLFCSLLVYETIFQHTLIKTAKILSQEPPSSEHCDFCLDWKWTTLGFLERLIEKVSTTYLLLLLFYLGILHFLDFFSLVAIVDSASTIYAGKKIFNLKHLLQTLIKETRFKGPLITSITVLLLASLILFGLFSLAIYSYIASLSILFMMLFGLLFITLLAKYIEWSAIWNMGIVISVLEEKKQGEVALLISSYLSRGNKRRGFLFALVFFVWRLGLRLISLYLGWVVGENLNRMAIIAPHVGLVCLGNVAKWLVFVVYFYDCKNRRRQEKKVVDVEESNAAAAGNGGTEISKE